MCLIGLAIDQDRRFPLVIAANRDEFFDRPAARLAWWTPDNGGPAILGGRDMRAGGTWLGLTTLGRLAMLTNVREPDQKPDATAPSRGRIVPDWLAGQDPPDRFWMRTALSGHNGFNLLMADFKLGNCYWASNRSRYPKRLERGLYGLSNAELDTPWPKVEKLKLAISASLEAAESLDGLSVDLFAALADREAAPDADLPSTGIPREWERALSSAFIRSAEGAYGTRCSTLVITEKLGRTLVTHVLERSFTANGVALLRRVALRNWPPRYVLDPEVDDDSPTVQEPVREGELDTSALPQTRRKRGRVRSLLKPA